MYFLLKDCEGGDLYFPTSWLIDHDVFVQKQPSSEGPFFTISPPCVDFGFFEGSLISWRDRGAAYVGHVSAQHGFYN